MLDAYSKHIPRSRLGARTVSPGSVRRALRREPVVPIADAFEGRLAHLRGVIQPGDTVPAPITGRPCVYWQVSIHAFSPRWFPFDHAEAGVPFGIDDGSERAWIEPRHASVALEVSYRGRTGRDLSEPELKALLARIGRFTPLPGRAWCCEAIVAPGDPVHVLGAGVREPDTERVRAVDDYRGGAPTRLRIRGATGVPLVIGNDRRLAPR